MSMKQDVISPPQQGQKRWLHVCSNGHRWPEIIHRRNLHEPLRRTCPTCRGSAVSTEKRGRA